MERAFIFHGTGGSPEENWFPWLKEQLESVGIPTEVPQFEDSDCPNMNRWLTQSSSFETGPETIAIGHSVGAVHILRMLERGHQFQAAFLTAPFANNLGWDVLKDSLYFAERFDWHRIKERCPHFEVYSSENDPYLDADKDVQPIADGLEVPHIRLDVERHFNMAEFPLLFERIMALRGDTV